MVERVRRVVERGGDVAAQKSNRAQKPIREKEDGVPTLHTLRSMANGHRRCDMIFSSFVICSTWPSLLTRPFFSTFNE